MSKDDESGNLPMTLTKEPRSLQYPPWETTTSNCSWSLKFPHGTSSPYRGGRLTAETTWTTPLIISNITCQAGRPPSIVLTSQVNLIYITAKTTEGLTERKLWVP
jgi:hypothetical protein